MLQVHEEAPGSDLAGQSFIVTGAASGIGAAVATLLSRSGAAVVLVDLDESRAQELVDECALENSHVVKADVSSEDGVAHYMSRATDLHGRIDGVHLNAGYCGPTQAVADVDLATYEKHMAINTRSVFLGIRDAVRQFRRQGSAGSIVVTASTSGTSGNQGAAAYCAAKHAVVGLVRAASLDHAREGIRINALCPGETDTPMFRAAMGAVNEDGAAEVAAKVGARIPLGRVAEPSELARAAVWLLGPASSYVTGSTLTVDGGLTVGRFASP
jgi:NAD(P)-dependent dehydrogenase (short-subunit alcohol dehydrogenase family)